MSKDCDKNSDPPYALLMVCFLAVSIISLYIVDKVFIPDDYTPAHVPCENNGMHYTGQFTINQTRCEDDYGNVRWIQR